MSRITAKNVAKLVGQHFTLKATPFNREHGCSVYNPFDHTSNCCNNRCWPGETAELRTCEVVGLDWKQTCYELVFNDGRRLTVAETVDENGYASLTGTIEIKDHRFDANDWKLVKVLQSAE